MSKVLLRQWNLLKLIPRQPKKTTSGQLTETLINQGFDTTRRTTQRDLQQLAGLFPELVNDGHRDEMGWSWLKDTPLHDLPVIDPPTALTFQLAQTFLSDFIPPAALIQLQPYMRCSEEVLQNVDQPGLQKWSEMIRIVPRCQRLIPAHFKPEVLEQIYEALMQQCQFKGRYQGRYRDLAEYEFNPLGLIFRDSSVYLVATLWDYKDPRLFALHRFEKIDLLDTHLNKPDLFNLDDYIASGATDYALQTDEPLELLARFDPDAASHLYETPLSEDQILIECEDGRVELRATVMDSLQLRWWLRGFGQWVEVIEPVELREEFITMLETSINTYTTVN